ncbi:unnamed protein product [Phytophthora fragariaefolia]|uniref:Unnamed protein product n=1 Tax=Phytophthora fragariaefolia TaxID=1490495 RepID=A0A9W7CXC4_9STRA|nr:unnamed protein product [Phytophthora fragariaefolia]
MPTTTRWPRPYVLDMPRCTGSLGVFLAPWRALGLDTEAASPSSVFRLMLVAVPSDVWTLLEDIHASKTATVQDAIRGHLHQLLQWSWTLGVLTTLQGIWRRRCKYRDCIEDTTATTAEDLLHGRLRSAYILIRVIVPSGSTAARRKAATVCLRALTTDAAIPTTIPRPTCTNSQIFLFFDGGSRGNPGPGGVGTAIVQVGRGDQQATILWMASVSYASRITNNGVEYRGLLNGLRYASRHRLYGMTVVSDSNLILSQLMLRRVPKACHLQGLYAQCRMIADRLMITRWIHYLRQFNKVADNLANLAMDSIKSFQVGEGDIPHLPTHWFPVLEFLQGDIEYWLDNNPDMEGNGRTPLHQGRLCTASMR